MKFTFGDMLSCTQGWKPLVQAFSTSTHFLIMFLSKVQLHHIDFFPVWLIQVELKIKLVHYLKFCQNQNKPLDGPDYRMQIIAFLMFQHASFQLQLKHFLGSVNFVPSNKSSSGAILLFEPYPALSTHTTEFVTLAV